MNKCKFKQTIKTTNISTCVFRIWREKIWFCPTDEGNCLIPILFLAFCFTHHSYSAVKTIQNLFSVSTTLVAVCRSFFQQLGVRSIAEKTTTVVYTKNVYNRMWPSVKIFYITYFFDYYCIFSNCAFNVNFLSKDIDVAMQ